MGHINNATVVSYLEIGRVHFLAKLFGARQVKDIPFIIAEVSCIYRAPIFLQNQVRLRIWVTDISRSSYRFHYEVFDPEDGHIFVEAETVQVMYDYEAKRPVPMNPELVGMLREYLAL
ncbi:MAG: acyl-CoA thioesterase [Syntrophorhabdaceae bacterium]|nr:acyl-CoA thioesterase [Syntrophorhabdaceae bacterium]